MLYKLTKERKCDIGGHRGLHGYGSSLRTDDTEDDGISQEEVLDGNVLMVDQLWLWALSSHTLLTFFPKRESDPIEGPLYQQADLRDSIFNDVNVDLTRQCDNALDLAALAALHATEKLTTSLKEFRSEGFRDKAIDFESVENKARSIRARHRAEGSRAERENRDNTSALLELRDIEDELQMLSHLFEQQYKVISSMHTIYNRPEMRDQTIHGRVFLSEALKRLTEYIHQADDMIRRVRTTRDDFDKLLQMVQRQAQVDEVRLSRLHADLASAQSRSVLIFTTFTVIFLPLQFFTGLFGMNTLEWGGGTFPSIRTIGEISLPSSVFLIVTTLFLAWSTTIRSFFRRLGQCYRSGVLWTYNAVCRPVVRGVTKVVMGGADKVKKKRRQDARGEGSGDGGVSRETSDFWERHRLEREGGYKIPDANKAVGVRGLHREREIGK
ncbi:hypothetical protein ESCO_005935 [Escovopsis weberi]|uniref:Magnesium transport protein CorA n=1 Tax=Escovopsis weberi TaxID=150374 RepID=A0A0M9VS15_ESCWE|nr:hypothetical protein ESCO_005935 [Escovopsis weberi]